MLIKYNGNKEKKVLEYMNKDFGLMRYEFTPVCSVSDSEFVKFLLHPDRQGLFSEVKSEEIKDDDKIKGAERANLPQVPQDDLKPRKGRPRKIKQETEE